MKNATIVFEDPSNVSFFKSIEDAELNIEVYDMNNVTVFDESGRLLNLRKVHLKQKRKLFGVVPFTADYDAVKIIGVNTDVTDDAREALRERLTDYFMNIGIDQNLLQNESLEKLIERGLLLS